MRRRAFLALLLAPTFTGRSEMPVAYPFNLRTIIRASKSRSQLAAFGIAQPRRGFGYVEPIGTDRPVFWTVQFRFTTAEAAAFKTWFNDDLQEGLLEFTLPIRTEFGTITHTCQFMPDGLLDLRETGEVWEYSAQIMARSLIGATLPSGFDDNPIVAADEGDTTTGWTVNAFGSLSTAGSYLRLTRNASAGTPALRRAPRRPWLARSGASSARPWDRWPAWRSAPSRSGLGTSSPFSSPSSWSVFSLESRRWLKPPS